MGSDFLIFLIIYNWGGGIRLGGGVTLGGSKYYRGVQVRANFFEKNFQKNLFFKFFNFWLLNIIKKSFQNILNL